MSGPQGGEGSFEYTHRAGTEGRGHLRSPPHTSLLSAPFTPLSRKTLQQITHIY